MKILVVDIDDYFDPKIIIFDQVFIASLLSLFLEIILGHQVILPIFLSGHFRREKYESHLERVSELSAFLGLFLGLCLHSGECCSHGIL